MGSRKELPSSLKAILISMRPEQWVKNLFLFSGLVFSRNLFQLSLVLKVCAGFMLFSVAASSLYLFNDIQDREYDRNHPQKRERPLAAGTLSVQRGYAVSIFLGLGSLALALILEPIFFAIL